MVTLERLNYDITRLADNLVPTDISSGEFLQKSYCNFIGRQLNSLIYTVSQVIPAATAASTIKQPALRVDEQQQNSGQEQPKQEAVQNGNEVVVAEQKKTATLKDSDVKKLAQALSKNDTFKGEICLGYNNLTDLSGLYIASMLKKNGSITKLDLSGNRLTEKSAVFVGQALMDSKNQSLTCLSFKGNLIGANGVRRVLEAAQMLPTLKNIDLGVLNQEAFDQVIDKIGSNESLISLQFEEYVKGKKQKWSCDAKTRFIKSLQENKIIRSVNIFSEDVCFVQNVAYYTQRNVNEYQSQIEAFLREKTLLPNQMFESFKNFNKQKEKNNLKDFKNMPVRQYLQNSFGPKLKDALFELKKLYNREKNKDLLTISKGVVFIAQYLVDNLSDFEKYGIQTEQVEEDELN